MRYGRYRLSLAVSIGVMFDEIWAMPVKFGCFDGCEV